MPLTSSKLSILKPKLDKHGKPQARTKFKDINNLYFYVYSNKDASISKRWIFRRFIDGKDKLLFIGDWPDLSLDDARIKAIEINKMIDSGQDPWAMRETERFVDKNGESPDAFEIIANQWLTTKKCDKTTSHQKKIIRSLEANVFPYFGKKSLVQITTLEILDVARRIEARGAEETAHRVVNRISDIFAFGMALGIVDSNPAISVSKLLKPVKSTCYAAAVDPNDLKVILRKIYSYAGTNPATAVLLKLSTMIPSRPGELRAMKWSDVDLQHSEWRYHIFKTNVDHIVPLPTQAVTLLHELIPLTGTSAYVFPSARDNTRCLSENTLKNAFIAMDINTQTEHTPHGFRACFRTITDEVLGFEFPVIETQLAHNVQDANGRSYNRTQYLSQRKVLLQTWANYLDDLRVSMGDVVEIGRRHAKV